ncbi:MAG: hypothetical protein KAW45_03705 [Thermoplasmatales archaeon]|nr:hypothetical protein [Thermoplasmatales archaeon]
MYKKFTIAAIMIVLVSMIFSPAVLSSEVNTADESGGSEIKALLASSGSINLTYDEDAVEEEIIPNKDPIEITINVSYQIEGFLAGLHTKLYKNRDVEIELAIVEKPEWCEASLSETNISTTPGTQEPHTSLLTLSVDETAPAFNDGKVKIQATCSAIKGLLKIITKVTGNNETFEIPFTVGYLPLIKVEFGNYSSEIPPLNVTTIPVNITNLGNGKTTVKIEVENESGNYTLDYPDNVILDSQISGGDYKKQIEIEIQPYKNFTLEEIKIKFTPHYTGDPELKGQTITTTLTLENDGSLKEDEEDLGFNSILLIVVIVVIILVLIFAIILKKRR